MKRILVIDDEEAIRASVTSFLSERGYDVQSLPHADNALARMETFTPDLLILDIMLPGMTGIELCQQLRRTSSIPIVFLSGLDSDMDRIVGLELGADDYLTKPFHLGELLARVKAVLRRASNGSAPTPKTKTQSSVLSHGEVKLDLERYLAFVSDTPVELTKTEFGLLRTLMRVPTRVYSRDELKEGAYGPGVYVADKTVNSHMRNLKNKLGDAGKDPVENVRGVGYRLAEAQ